MAEITATYIKTSDLCARLGGVSPRTLKNWQNWDDNPLPEPKIKGCGSQNRYLLSEVEAWETRQNSPTIDSSRENQAA